MTDPQAETAGPRTAEGWALLALLEDAALVIPGGGPLRDIIAIEDAAFAQGVAAARAAVEAEIGKVERQYARKDYVAFLEKAAAAPIDAIDRLAALDSTVRRPGVDDSRP